MRLALTLVLSLGTQAFAQTGRVPDQNVRETPLCGTRPESSPITVEMNVAVWMFYGQPQVYFMPERALCLRTGQFHKVIYFDTKEVIGEVEIVRLLRTTLNRIDADLAIVKDASLRQKLKDNIQQVRPLNNLNYPDLKPDDAIIIAVLGRTKKAEKFINPYTRVVPGSHPYATTVDYDRVAKMVAKEKPAIFDVRKPEHFRWWHLPGSINVPQPIGQLRAQPLELDAFERIFQSVPQENLPQDKNAPILIMGHSLIDWNPYHLVLGFRIAGYTNLYWYRGGQEDWHQIRLIQPDEKEFNLATISGQELATRLKEFTLVDMRERNYYDELHIEGSVYGEFSSYIVPAPRHSDPLDDIAFLKRRVPWNMSKLPADKSRPIVLIGYDQADWRPVLGAIVAKAAGYNNLKWYKGGYAEWRSLNRWFGRDKFPQAGSLSKVPYLQPGQKTPGK
jgi:rhodanese-related sulfurtransferase